MERIQTRTGTVTDHVGYFSDWMATAAELADAKTPQECNSTSFVPTLLSQNGQQQSHEFLYCY